MAAAATDYFIKVTPNFSTTIGASGVSDGTTTTIPLVSVATLPTDTGIELVINRVDASGVATNNYETIRGVVSGSNIVSSVRGVEGVAQGWPAGTVVEYLVAADIQNRMVTGITVEHNQDGTHASTIAKTTATQTLTNKSLTTPKIASLYQDSIGGSNLLTMPAATDTLVGKATTDTLTNKRITKRVVSAASYTTDTGSSLNSDSLDLFVVTAQAGALKFNNPGGTPTQGQSIIIRIKDNGTARALTYDTQFRAMGTALPSTTVLSKTLYMGYIYNSTDTKWDLIAAAQEV